MDKVIIEFAPNEVQKIVEYLWTKPYGEVCSLIDIIKIADQKALAKLNEEKVLAEKACSITQS